MLKCLCKNLRTSTRRFLIKIKMIWNILLDRKVEKKIYKKEKYFFRSNYVRYWVKEREDGSVEFWCHPTKDYILSGDQKDICIGVYKNGQIEKCKDFYQLDWSIEKGGMRLFEEFLETVHK